MLKKILWTVFVLFCLGLVTLGVVARYVWVLNQNLPEIEELHNSKYNLPTLIYDRNDRLIKEYYAERRILLKPSDIPTLVKESIIAVEDSRFYSHYGIDPIRIFKSFYVNIAEGRYAQGASTITQQTAKLYLLRSEKTIERKVKEILLALKMERDFREKYGEEHYKDQILALYLNKAFWGRQAYGIEAAADQYFSKKSKDLKPEEAALLAGLLKAPSRLSPLYRPKEAKQRRNTVLRLMARNGFLTAEELEAALKTGLNLKLRQSNRVEGTSYFVEQVRRELVAKYGIEGVNTGGYRVYTTMDTKLQNYAQQTLRKGLEQISRRHGYAGAKTNIGGAKGKIDENKLARITATNNLSIGSIISGVVEQITDTEALINFGAARSVLQLEDTNWARPTDLQSVLNKSNQLTSMKKAFKKGDIIKASITAQLTREQIIAASQAKPTKKVSTASPRSILGAFLRLGVDSKSILQFIDDDVQILRTMLYEKPQNNGGMVVMSPQSGEVLAIVGGYDFDKSQFNRAIQSRRQPGSAFKPLVFAAAIDHQYKTSTIIEDTPLVFPGGEKSPDWLPKNYSGRFSGDITFRDALVYSKNIPTIKIAQDIGVKNVLDYAAKLGINTQKMPRDLSVSLGSASVTLVEMVKAYSVFSNGGRLVQPFFIRKIEEHTGENQENFSPQSKKVIAASTAFLMNNILQDVVRRGTGKKAQAIGRLSAGKTGTTSLNTDAWYIGYIPQLIAGVYVGNDKPIIPLGTRETGGKAAAPIWIDFMKEAVKAYPEVPVKRPSTIIQRKIDKTTGRLACHGEEEKTIILEYFRVGEEPQLCTQQVVPTEETSLEAIQESGIEL